MNVANDTHKSDRTARCAMKSLYADNFG
jgi:hypothetical protein